MTGKLKKYILISTLFLLALAPRLICLFQAQHSIIKNMLPLDTGDYVKWALEIANGTIVGKDVFYAMPLYAYFLGAVFKIFAGSIEAVKIMQIFLGAVNVVLIFYIAKKVFNDNKIAIIAFILALFFKLSVFYELLLESSTIATFLFLILIYILVSISAKPSAGKFVLMGVVSSLAFLAKANFLITIPLVMLWFIFNFKEVTRGKKTLLLALFITPVFITLFLVAARNYAVGRDFVPLTAHSGINFYMGNGPYANGRYPAVPFLVGSSGGMIKQSVLVASQTLGKSLKPSEASAYWTKETFNFIKDNPAQYMGLLGNKLKLFVSGIEMPDILSYSFSTRFIPGLKFLWLSFFLLIPLGIAGMVLTFSRDRKISILTILFIGYACGIISFMVNERYKVPLYPFFIIFSSTGLVYMFKPGVNYIKKICAVVVFILLLSVSIIDRPFLEKYIVNQAASYNLVGAELFNNKEYEKALEYFSEAVRLWPSQADYHNSLGASYMSLSNPVMAEVELKRAIEINPNFFMAYENLAKLYLSQGMKEDAERCMQKYRETSPY